MRTPARIIIPTAVCGLVALEIMTGSFVWKFSAYKSIRATIESDNEDAAVLKVQQLSKNKLFKPDWTIQGALPKWNWLYDLDARLFGCPSCRGNGYTLLQYAAARGQQRLATTLLAKGASINLRGDRGASVLVSAIGGGNTNIVTLLIAQGADPKVTIPVGPILHVAAGFAQQPEVIEPLLEAGVNLNGLDLHGRTPLDWAITYSNKKAIEFLTLRGALTGEPQPNLRRTSAPK